MNTNIGELHAVHIVLELQVSQFAINDEHNSHFATPLSTYSFWQGQVLVNESCDLKFVPPSQAEHSVSNGPVQV